MFRPLKAAAASRQSVWTVVLDEFLLLILASNYPMLFSSSGIGRHVNVKWSIVAGELCRKTEDIRMFKTEKQCKERWLNHLNPFLNK